MVKFNGDKSEAHATRATGFVYCQWILLEMIANRATGRKEDFFQNKFRFSRRRSVLFRFQCSSLQQFIHLPYSLLICPRTSESLENFTNHTRISKRSSAVHL
jgi:hypothetical protein